MPDQTELDGHCRCCSKRGQAPLSEDAEAEGRCRCGGQRVPPYRKAGRWLGPVVLTVYRIVRDSGLL